MYNALIFDLDGTLIDTIPDVARAINKALEVCGFKSGHSIPEVMSFMGNGAKMFMKRALGQDGSEENIAKLRPHYLHYYEEYQCDTAMPYEGVVEFLKKAKRKGIRLYVMTNKPDHLAKIIIEKKIGPDVFDRVIGQIDGVPHKPDPTVSNKLIEEDGLDKKSILWIGDSLVDLESANNVGVDCALMMYGYGFLDGSEPSKYHFNSINELDLML